MTSLQTKKTYDAFLAVNKADAAAAHFVRSIAKWLEDHAGLTVWLEEWEMIPGTPWMESRENALDDSNCCVVFIGSEGIGPWQNESWRSAYDYCLHQRDHLTFKEQFHILNSELSVFDSYGLMI